MTVGLLRFFRRAVAQLGSALEWGLGVGFLVFK
jgi:hypothetical protein